jgi:TRAP-type transport system periplasmic protein
MSSSPGDSDWLDDSMPLPRAGLIWPWILVGMILFCLGLWLLYPTTQDGHSNFGQPGPLATASPTPGEAPTSDVAGKSLNCLFVDSASSSFALAAERLKGLVHNNSDARVEVSLHPSGVYKGKKLDELEIIEEVRSGNAQMAIVTSSPLTNFERSFEVLDLPFLFDSYEQADRVITGPIGKKMLRSLESEGMVGLGTLEIGFRVFSSSMPLPTMADFNKRRVRVMQSSMAISMARMLGCEAVPSPVDKIYQMGKEGFIDAADRTYPTYWDFKLYEVHRYITESRHSYTMKVIIMNRDAYRRLSEEDRKMLQAAVETVQDEQRQQQRREDQRVKQDCRKMGIQIYELSDSERNEFVEACKPLYNDYVKLHGAGLLDAIRAQAAPAATPTP